MCARRAGVTGRLGDWPIRPFSPLGPLISFRAICTGALSISCSVRSVEVSQVTVRSMLRADL